VPAASYVVTCRSLRGPEERLSTAIRSRPAAARSAEEAENHAQYEETGPGWSALRPGHRHKRLRLPPPAERTETGLACFEFACNATSRGARYPCASVRSSVRSPARGSDVAGPRAGTAKPFHVQFRGVTVGDPDAYPSGDDVLVEGRVRGRFSGALAGSRLGRRFSVARRTAQSELTYDPATKTATGRAPCCCASATAGRARPAST
jgi:hypothetical protein